MSKKYRVGILGATGAVGQRFVQLLADHPWFQLEGLYASEKSAGKTYGEAVDWRIPVPMPEGVAHLPVTLAKPDPSIDLVFSALHKEQAKVHEPAFAEAGIPVVSNASAFRMTADVPLIVPEVNSAHIDLIPTQQAARGWKGCLVTNPNCSTIGLVMPLKALSDAFGVESFSVVTMQARSGAGYPGPPDEVICDNVLPYIGGEEDKLETEPCKILGHLADGAIEPLAMKISAACHRVDVVDGHLEALSFKFKRKPKDVAEIIAALESYSEKAALGLPSSPPQAIIVQRDEDRPQPKLDRDAGAGMSVHVGRIRPCSVLDYKMVILSHNTIRGAAGAALLNGELLAQRGFLDK